MRISIFFFTASCLGLLAVAACSSTTTATPGQANSDACGRVFEAYAKVDALCVAEGAKGQPSGSYLGAQKGSFARSCGNLASAPGSGITTAYLDACASALNAVTACTDSDKVDACRTPMGTLGDGAGCADDSQCASGDCKNSSSSSGGSDAGVSGDAGLAAKAKYCGTCVPTLAEGAACGTAGITASCRQDLRCAGGKCVTRAPVADGVSCVFGSGSNFGTLSCNLGSFCDYTTTGGTPTGTCKKVPARGEACTTRCATGSVCIAAKCSEPLADGAPCTGTGSNECKASSSCSTTDKKCVARTYAGEGGACGTNASSCAAGLSCVYTGTDFSNGVCRARVPEGGPCTEVSSGTSPTCDYYLTCVDNKCQFEDANLCK